MFPSPGRSQTNHHPLGFLVNWKPTLRPDKATLSVIHMNKDHEDDVLENVPDNEIAMSLSPGQTQEFLKRISTEEVKLRVTMERNGEQASQELRVVFKVPTKSDIASLSISQEQKDVLASAAECYAKSKLGEKWAPTIKTIADVALSLIK